MSFLTGGIICFIIGVISGCIMAFSEVKSIKDEAIDHGHAHYDATTGEFTWNKKDAAE